MGSVPGSLLARKQTRRTAVQQICIDQNSGQVRQRKLVLRGEQEERVAGMRRRLSSAMELAGERLKIGKGADGKRADSMNREELANLQRKLIETERAKSELEMRLRVVEREKRELEAEWARNRDLHGGEGMMQLPNSVGKMLEEDDAEEGMGRGRMCACRWKWEEHLEQRLRERDEIWAKRVVEEVERRRKLIRAIEAKLGQNEVAELMEKTEREGGELAENGTNHQKMANGKCQAESAGYRKASTVAGSSSDPSRQRASTFSGHPQPKAPIDGGGNGEELVGRKKSDPRLDTPSISTPLSRLSTASTIQSARNDLPKPVAIFRPSLRRQALVGGGKGAPTVLDLDGICLDEKNGGRNEGTLEEESEGEEGDEWGGPPLAQQQPPEQRRASTSAKSRDSGISY